MAVFKRGNRKAPMDVKQKLFAVIDFLLFEGCPGDKIA
jgi:hypothetical protein